MRISSKDATILFRALKAHSAYKNVPVGWVIVKSGPNWRVRKTGGGVVVEINTGRKRGFEEIHADVMAALPHARDMVMGRTWATIVGDPPKRTDHGKEYKASRLEIQAEAQAQIPAWREGVVDIFDGFAELTRREQQTA